MSQTRKVQTNRRTRGRDSPPPVQLDGYRTFRSGIKKIATPPKKTRTVRRKKLGKKEESEFASLFDAFKF
jgi:hypothetical protein